MNFQKISEIFPPPKFLDFSYAGLSISDSSLRCIQFVKKDKSLKVEKYGQREIAEGDIVSGEIKNPSALTDKLKSLKEELNLGYVKVSLPEEKAYLFTIQIPKVEKKDIRNAIEFKIEENVPLRASEVVFDYTLIDPYKYKDHLNVVVSALPASLVDTYVDAVSKAGLSLLSLEIESQAVARAVLPDGFRGTTVLCYFGQKNVGLYIVKDRVVHFTSTISMSDEKDIPAFVSREIKKVMTYWKTSSGQDDDNTKTDQVIVCGEVPDESMIQFVKNQDKIDISLANVWSNVCDLNAVIPPINFHDSLLYAPAVGLALPIDFLI